MEITSAPSHGGPSSPECVQRCESILSIDQGLSSSSKKIVEEKPTASQPASFMLLGPEQLELDISDHGASSSNVPGPRLGPEPPLPAIPDDGEDTPDIIDILFGNADATGALAAKRDPSEWQQAPAEIGPPGVGCTIPPVVPVPKCKQGKAIAWDMRDYARDTVDLHKRVTGLEKLKPAWIPFVPDGSISHADE